MIMIMIMMETILWSCCPVVFLIFLPAAGCWFCAGLDAHLVRRHDGCRIQYCCACFGCERGNSCKVSPNFSCAMRRAMHGLKRQNQPEPRSAGIKNRHEQYRAGPIQRPDLLMRTGTARAPGRCVAKSQPGRCRSWDEASMSLRNVTILPQFVQKFLQFQKKRHSNVKGHLSVH